MTKSKHVCLLVLDNQINIVIGNPAGNIQGISSSVVKNLLKENMPENEDSDEEEEDGLFNFDEVLVNSENIHGVKVIGTDEGKYWKFINALILQKMNIKTSVLGCHHLFLFKSNFPSFYFKTHLPSLENSPVIPLTCPIEINDAFKTSFDWQKEGVQAGIEAFCQANQIFESQKNMSMHTRVPVGNFPILGDSNIQLKVKDSLSKAKIVYHAEELYAPEGNADLSLFISDIFFARQLQAKAHLLWCSRSNKPDLGTSSYNILENNLTLNSQEHQQQITVTNAGFYRTICVEVSLLQLAVASILSTSMIDEFEGGSSATAFSKLNETSLQDMMQGVSKRDNLTQHDQMALTSTTFGILKRMISTWMKIIESADENSVSMAKELIGNFYRWIKSEASLLYDPAMLEQLQNYMKRYFFHIIAEFKRLGATVIHANFNRIIFDTKKKGLKSAKDYTNYRSLGKFLFKFDYNLRVF